MSVMIVLYEVGASLWEETKSFFQPAVSPRKIALTEPPCASQGLPPRAVARFTGPAFHPWMELGTLALESK